MATEATKLLEELTGMVKKGGDRKPPKEVKTMGMTKTLEDLTRKV